MRNVLAFIALWAALPSLALAAAADLSACPPAVPGNPGEIERTTPLPIPPALRNIVQADQAHLAVATLAGGTICVDASWIETAEAMALSADQRFLSFGWLGYESYGHKLIDRAGKGQEIETGVTPAFSPSGRLFAAVDQTEAEFGSLSGFALWRVGSQGVAEVIQASDITRMQDWRIDGWAGETCINLSALPLDQLFETQEAMARAPRRRFAARPASGSWRIAPGQCPST